MKIKIFFTIILIFSVVAFLLSKLESKVYNPQTLSLPPTSGESPFDSTYLICALDYGTIGTTNRYHDSLYFNLWHGYPQYDPTLQRGWLNRAPDDILTADSSRYFRQIKSILDNNINDGMKTLMNRVKIDFLAMGQRSEYKCTENHYSSDYWFYTYYHHDARTSKEWQDNTAWGGGTWVRYAPTAPAGLFRPGYVVDSLISNREQINYVAYSSRYMADQLFPWFIKPRIRIDSVFANNPTNRNKNICRIEILRFDGNIIKSVDLKASYFLDTGGHYNGQYIENYNFPPGVNLRIDPVTDPNHPDEPGSNTNPFNPDHKTEGDQSCKVDFRVWWYGSCDMWIDYVRVDNGIADGLMNPNSPNYTVYNNWIKWEVNLANYSSSPAEFYVEEFEFNMVPCMSYVAKKIRQYSDNKFNLMCVFMCGEYIFHIPKWWDHVPDINYISRNLIDTLQLREFIDYAYPFKGYMPNSIDNEERVYVPSTLPNSTFSSEQGRLALDTTPAGYDDWLQGYLDRDPSYWNDYFTKWMKHGDTISKLRNLTFVTMIQTHLWYSQGYMLREPTNEEIKMMVNVSVTYGAKAQLYFMYGNWGTIGDTSNGKTYGRGVTGGNPYSNQDPRTENVYGQNKWTAIKDINRKLHQWGPTFMSFDNASRHSYIYRIDDERNALVTDTYFRWLVTGRPGNSGLVCPHGSEPVPPPETGLVYDCTQDTYLQAAVFKNASESYSLYFMIINRRCSPFIDSTTDDRNGGRRKVKVIFDTDNNKMSAAKKWRITDIGNPG